MMPSKMNSHRQPDKPLTPFIPVYKAACFEKSGGADQKDRVWIHTRYPLNIEPTNAEPKKIHALFAISRFVYHAPSTVCTAG